MTAGTLKKLGIAAILRVAQCFGDNADATMKWLREQGHEVTECEGVYLVGNYRFGNLNGTITYARRDA